MKKPTASYSWSEPQPQVRQLTIIRRETSDETPPLSRQNPPPQPATIPDQFADLIDFPTMAQIEGYGIKELRSPLSD